MIHCPAAYRETQCTTSPTTKIKYKGSKQATMHMFNPNVVGQGRPGHQIAG